MEIIEYEPINLYDGRFCKVFHSDWIQLEKPKDVNSAPHFHWHNSFEFNCSISGTLRCEIGSTMTYAKEIESSNLDRGGVEQVGAAMLSERRI